MTDPLLKASDIARLFGWSRYHVYRQVRDGKLRAHRVANSRALRFTAEDVAAAIGESITGPAKKATA